MNEIGVRTRLFVFARSMLVLGMLTIGAPTALLFVAQERFGGGSPFAAMPAPSSWSLDRVGSALSDRLTDRTIADIVIRVSLVAAWVAVVVIVLTVAAELAHMVRHDGLAMSDVRGFGVSQRTARMIASGLLVIIPLFTSPANAVARTGSSLVPEPRAPPTAEAGGVGDFGADATTGAVPPPWWAGGSIAAATSRRPEVAGEYLVRAGDSVFGIAERLAGPDQAAVDAYAKALIDANLGRRMPDGRTFDNAAFLDVGWVLELPPTPAALESSVGPEVDDVHVVERGDSLWSIADEELGDPLRWPEVFAANEGRTFDDGETLRDPDSIQMGWDLVVPSASGDGPSVSDADDASPVILADEVADGVDEELEVLEVAEVAAEITHVDPDHEAPIAPAEITHVDPHPEVSTGGGSDDSDIVHDGFDPGEASVAVAGTAISRQDNVWDAAEQDGATDSRVDDVAAPADVTPDATIVNQAEITIADAATAVDEVAAVRPGAPGAGVGDAPSDPADELESDAPAFLTLGRAAMLSAGLLTLLAVRRRNQLRRAQPRSRLPEPAPGPVATERILRSIDSGERFARVDIATRAVALSLIERDQRVLAVSVATDGALELRSTGPVVLGPPWEGADSTWHLAASVPLELLADDARRVGAPCPALVQLGSDAAGRDVYVDLEALEALEVGGPGAHADAIVAALAATLAGSVLAEVSTLVGLGVADDAFLGHRNYVPVRDPQRAFEAAADAIGSTATMTRSTFELRARGTSGETWEPAVVLASAAAGTVSAPSNRTGLALVSASPIHGPSSRLAPDGDSWLLLPVGIRLIPVGLTPHDLASIAQLVTLGEPEPEAFAWSTSRQAAHGDHTIVGPTDDGFPIRMDDGAGARGVSGRDGADVLAVAPEDDVAVGNESSADHPPETSDHTVVAATDDDVPIQLDDSASARGVSGPADADAVGDESSADRLLDGSADLDGDHSVVAPTDDGLAVRADAAADGRGVSGPADNPFLVASPENDGDVESGSSADRVLDGRARVVGDHTVVGPTDEGVIMQIDTGVEDRDAARPDGSRSSIDLAHDDSSVPGGTAIDEVRDPRLESDAARALPDDQTVGPSPGHDLRDLVDTEDAGDDLPFLDDTGADGLPGPSRESDDTGLAHDPTAVDRLDDAVDVSEAGYVEGAQTPSGVMPPPHQLLVRLLGAVEVVDLNGDPVE